jgi:DnaJ-class molecular chaperone
MKDCPECLGDKVVQEPCPRCKWSGILRRKRLFRKEMELLDCTNTKCIWGAIIKICPACKGLGQVP